MTPDTALSEAARRIKDVGLRAGAKVVGIAAAEAFNRYVPSGHPPPPLTTMRPRAFALATSCLMRAASSWWGARPHELENGSVLLWIP
jgi:hypothetical protein